MTKKQIEITLFILSTILFAVGIYLSVSLDSHQKTIYWIAAVLSVVGAVGPSTVEKLSFGSGGVRFHCYTPEKRISALASVDDNPTENKNEELKKLALEAEGRNEEARSPEDYLLLSTRALRSGSLEEALRYAYRGLSRDDADLKVKAALAYRLGSIFIELGDDLLAVDKFNTAIELDPSFSWPHVRLGRLYEKLGRNRDAEKAFKEALRLEPGDESHQSTLTSFHEKLDKGDVSEVLQVSLKPGQGDGEVRFDLGIHREENTGEAAKSDEKSLDNTVVHELDWNALEDDETPVQEKKMEVARETAEGNVPVADKGDNVDTVRVRPGSIYAKDSDGEEPKLTVNDSERDENKDDGLPKVKKVHQEVGEGEPGSVPSGSLAGGVTVGAGLSGGGDGDLLSEDKNEPKDNVDNEGAVAWKGEREKAGGESTDEAPPAEEDKGSGSGGGSEYKFQKTAGKEPRDCIDQYNLGLLYQRMGKLEEAEVSYREALILDPAYVKTHNNLGLLYQRMGRDEKAEASYREALRLDPGFSWAFSNLGSLYKKIGKYDEAEKSYREALRLDPCDAIAEYNLGLLYQALGRNSESEKAYREALRLEPNYVKAHFNLGNLYKKTGKMEEAEKAYRCALRLEPNDASAQYNLGLLYHSMERYEEAEEAYMAALTISPEYIKSHNNLGILYEKMKRPGDAERSYRRAIALDPDYLKARNNLALLLKNMGRAEAPNSETKELSELDKRAVKRP